MGRQKPGDISRTRRDPADIRISPRSNSSPSTPSNCRRRAACKPTLRLNLEALRQSRRTQLRPALLRHPSGFPASTSELRPPHEAEFKEDVSTAHTFNVPANANPAQTYLRLGYLDDSGYSDNGYYSHDDGTGDPYKNQPNARVVITIVHGAGTGDAESPGSAARSV